MKEIGLTKGKIALVDDEDYEILWWYKWFATECGKNEYWYGKGYVGDNAVYMHRFIMGVSDRNILVDHIDRNTLNNQRSNLRICNRGQNRSNSKHTGVRGLDFRGVQKSGPANFIACITVDKKIIRSASFATPVLAAIEYNNMALKYKGEFATLNIIPSEIV